MSSSISSSSSSTSSLSLQYVTFLVLVVHIWHAKPANLPLKVPALDIKISLVLLGTFLLAPFMRLILLLSFVYHWLVANYRQEVNSVRCEQETHDSYIVYIFKARTHFLYKQLKTLDGVLGTWNLVIITVMYLTRVLPAPW